LSETRETRVVFIHSPELEEFGYPAEIPLVTKRAGLTRERVSSMGLLSGPDRSEQAPVSATREELEKFHTPRYLDALKRAAEGGFVGEDMYMGLGTPDCPVFEDVYRYPVLACGATLTGARLLLSDEADAVFNPSGGYHHAGPERAAGFCYINDLALACTVLAEHGKRVLYLDIDVHHGDGVQNAFYDRSDVMTISFHESGRTLFPGSGFEHETGAGEGRGYSVNVPMRPGTYDEAYMRAFNAIAVPLIGAYDADMIVLQLGMDALAGDPLANLSLTNNVHADVVEMALGLGKPLLITGGGGYDVENTVRGWALAWTVLCGEESEDQASIGLGGVMLETTDWHGGLRGGLRDGLRDRVLVPGETERQFVEPAVDAVIETIQENVFPIHGL